MMHLVHLLRARRLADRVAARWVREAADDTSFIKVVKAGPLGPGDTRHEIVLLIRDKDKYRWEGSYAMVDQFQRRRYGKGFNALRWLEQHWGKGTKLP